MFKEVGNRVSFTVDKPDILMVDHTGEIHALAAGQAEITVTAHIEGKEKSTTIPITVTDAQFTDVTLSLANSPLYVGHSSTINASARTTDGRVLSADNLDISCIPENPGMLSVSGRTVTALKEGTSSLLITVRLGTAEHTETLSVTVGYDPNELAQVEAISGNAVLKVGEQTQLTVQGVLHNGDKITPADGTTLRYTSSDPDMLLIDDAGRITARSTGNASVEVEMEYNGIKKTAAVAIKVEGESPLSSLSLSAPGKMFSGTEAQLELIGAFENGVTLSLPIRQGMLRIVSSTPEDIAVLNAGGILQGVHPGSVTLCGEATYAGKRTETASIVVNIEERLLQDVVMDFLADQDRNQKPHDFAKLDVHGWQIDQSTGTGTSPNVLSNISFSYMSFGIRARMFNSGDKVVFQFNIPEDGTYRLDVEGRLYSGGATAEIYIDDTYMGIFDHYGNVAGTGTISQAQLNCVYLTKGVHRLVYRRINSGSNNLFLISKLHLVALGEFPSFSHVVIDANKYLLSPGERARLDVQALLSGGHPVHFIGGYGNPEEPGDRLALTIQNPSILYMSSPGVLTALNPGKTQVTAHARVRGVERTAMLDLEVTEATLSELIVSLSTQEIFTGDSANISVSAKTSDGRDLDLNDLIIYYVPEDPSYLSVAGKSITAKKAGDTSLTVRALLGSASVSVVVPITVKLRPFMLSHITVGIDKSVLPVGGQAQIAAQAIMYNGEPAPVGEYDIFYSSSDPKVATIDDNGVLTATGEGSANVTIYIKKDTVMKSSSLPVSVNGFLPVSSAVLYAPAILPRGESGQLQVVALLETGVKVPLSNSQVEFLVESQPENVLSINSSGSITALSEGLAQVTARVALGGTTVETPSVSVEIISGTFGDVVLDFTSYHTTSGLLPMNITLADYGWQINRQLTSSRVQENVQGRCVFKKYGINTAVLTADTPVVSDLTFDVNIPNTGIYTLEVNGGKYAGGNISAVFVNGEYMGKYDFAVTPNGSMRVGPTEKMNPIRLTAGIHTVTFRMLSESKSGVRFFPGTIAFRAVTEEPASFLLETSVDKTQLSLGETVRYSAVVRMPNGEKYVFDPVSAGKWEPTSWLRIHCDRPEVLEPAKGELLIPKMPGEATLTMTARVWGEEKTVSQLIIVDDQILSTLTASLSKDLLIPGDDCEIEITALTNSGRILDNSNLNLVCVSKDIDIASVNGKTLTAHSLGSTEIEITATLAGLTKSFLLPVTISEPGFDKVRVEADTYFMHPDSSGVSLSVIGLDSLREEISLSEAQISYESMDPNVVTVTNEGLVLPVEEGEGLIRVSVTLGGISRKGEIRLTVSRGKTERSIYRADMVAAARENIQKYSWAKAPYNQAIRNADQYIGRVDWLWDSVTTQELPRSILVGYRHDPNTSLCRYCGVNLNHKYGSKGYVWEYNFISQPWKIQCPDCKRRFPSNDFGEFYKLGIDENGNWDYSQAKDENAKLVLETKGGYLKNTL